MKTKPSKNINNKPRRAPEPLRLRRKAMFTAVSEVHDALGRWLYNDASASEREHDFEQGEYVARQLHRLVEMLIEEIKDEEHAAHVCSTGTGAT